MPLMDHSISYILITNPFLMSTFVITLDTIDKEVYSYLCIWGGLDLLLALFSCKKYLQKKVPTDFFFFPIVQSPEVNCM